MGRYSLVVAVVVAATLSGASVLFQLTERAHVHAGVAAGWESWLGVATDFVGFATLTLVAVQLFWGYRVTALSRPRYRAWHPRMGLAIAVLLGAHGIAGTVHSLIGAVETMPIALDFIGVGLALLVGALIWSGERLLRQPRRTGGMKATHSWAVVALAIVVTAHSLAGVYHTVTG